MNEEDEEEGITMNIKDGVIDQLLFLDSGKRRGECKNLPHSFHSD